MTAIGNPYAHLRAAALGELDAFRALAKLGAEAAAFNDLDTLCDGLIFARLAAARGERDDTLSLIHMLATAEVMCADVPHLAARRSSLQGELIAIASAMADDGDDAAEWFLSKMVDYSSPPAAEIAKGVRKQMEALG